MWWWCWWSYHDDHINVVGSAQTKIWTFNIFSDETSPVTTFTELFSAVCNKTSIIGGSVLSSAYWALSSTMGSQWTVLQLTIGESQTRCNYRYFGWHEHCSEVHAETFCQKKNIAQRVPSGTSGAMWALLRGCSSLQPRNKGFQNNCSADFSGLYTSLWRINDENRE